MYDSGGYASPGAAGRGVIYAGGGQAACGPTGCGLVGDACLEPAGQSTTVNWKYVGGGKGGYEKLTTMKYVGEGGGGFDREPPPSNNCSTKLFGFLCLVLVVLVGCCLGRTVLSGQPLPAAPIIPSTAAVIVRTPEPTTAPAVFLPASSQSPDFTYDCVDQSTTWTSDRQEWCCRNFGVRCDAAGVGTPPPPPPPAVPAPAAATQTWTAGAQAAPGPEAVQAVVLSPPVLFDCQAGLDSWQRGWSELKKKWCCAQDNVGCQPEQAAAAPAAAQQGAAAPANATFQLPALGVMNPPYLAASQSAAATARAAAGNATASAAAPAAASAAPAAPPAQSAGVADQLFDCHLGEAMWEKEWSVGKKSWCCRTARVACDPFDCREGMAGTAAQWADTKRAWCCSNKQLGCAAAPSSGGAQAPPPPGPAVLAYACHAGLATWSRGWSSSKKAWCCEHEQLGCEVEAKIFDCQVGLSTWEAGWSIAKRTWCCENEHVACSNTAKAAPVVRQRKLSLSASPREHLKRTAT